MTASCLGKLLVKSKNLPIYFFLFLGCLTEVKAQEVPFSKGVNLSNWFQAPTTRQIQFTRYTKKDFEQIQRLGCDVIRLPINLHFMTDGEPDYTIDPLFYNFLDEVVSWAEELGLHLILDNHTFDPAENTDPNVGIILEKVWSQMASHYKSGYQNLYYEVLNEPHGISESDWNNIQQEVVEAIREIDSEHTIIIGTANWNSYTTLAEMPEYEDDNLIYTFHFYDPFIFTHQGASWTDPSMVPLAGVPFPYSASGMPQLPEELEGTWIEGAFNDYHNAGNITHVKDLIDIAINFKNQRNVALFCGEFGVYMPNSDNQNRVAWYDSIRSYFEANDIAWTSWDYHGGFGLFEENSAGYFEHDLNVPLLQALEFNVPEQTPYQLLPDSTGFSLYDDYIGTGINGSASADGVSDFYDDALPNNGNYCLYWSEAVQYNTINFDFRAVKDLSELVEEEYAVDFLIRGAGEAFSFDIRFIDTDTEDPEDHPWRMRYTIDESAVEFDSSWHHVRVPLTDFTEQGAWEGEWFNPIGAFDWQAIDRFEIVTEHGAMGTGEIWIDNLLITNQDTSQVLVTEKYPDEQITGIRREAREYFSIYPNPSKSKVIVQNLSSNPVEYAFLDSRGRILKKAMLHNRIELDVSSLAEGIYLIQFTDPSGKVVTRRISKL